MKKFCPERGMEVNDFKEFVYNTRPKNPTKSYIDPDMPKFLVDNYQEFVIEKALSDKDFRLDVNLRNSTREALVLNMETWNGPMKDATVKTLHC